MLRTQNHTTLIEILLPIKVTKPSRLATGGAKSMLPSSE
jgi:hypothetical protein